MYCENQPEKGLEEIVGDHQLLDIVGWSVFHESWASVADDVVVNSTETKHRPRGRHEKPVIHPGKENHILGLKKDISHPSSHAVAVDLVIPENICMDEG